MALRTRLKITCRTESSSKATGAAEGSNSVVITMERAATSAETSRATASAGEESWPGWVVDEPGRANQRKSASSRSMRPSSLRTASTLTWSATDSALASRRASTFSSSSAELRGFLISCASPVVRSPTTASCSTTRSRRSAARASVTSTPNTQRRCSAETTRHCTRRSMPRLVTSPRSMGASGERTSRSGPVGESSSSKWRPIREARGSPIDCSMARLTSRTLPSWSSAAVRMGEASTMAR